jgi:hypothetical protein
MVSKSGGVSRLLFSNVWKSVGHEKHKKPRKFQTLEYRGRACLSEAAALRTEFQSLEKLLATKNTISHKSSNHWKKWDSHPGCLRWKGGVICHESLPSQRSGTQKGSDKKWPHFLNIRIQGLTRSPMSEASGWWKKCIESVGSLFAARDRRERKRDRRKIFRIFLILKFIRWPFIHLLYFFGCWFVMVVFAWRDF